MTRNVLYKSRMCCGTYDVLARNRRYDMSQMKASFAYDVFAETFDIHFHNKQLLQQAFTHSSYVNEHHQDPLSDYERLEFLGDAVLELTVSRFLYDIYPQMAEGDLTKLRAAIVCEPALVAFAEALDFSRFILLGKGEEATGGRQRPALLADVFEAFIGALYMDQGLDGVQPFLQDHVFPDIERGAFSHKMDYKSQLQERVQREDRGDIIYKIVEENGPAHHREFVTKIFVGEQEMGVGVGRSKKDAEQHAAHQALKVIDEI